MDRKNGVFNDECQSPTNGHIVRSTRSLTADEESQLLPGSSLSCTKSFVEQLPRRMYWIDMLSSTFISTSYTVSSLVTLAGTATEMFPGISLIGLFVGLPAGLFFSFCVADAHDAINEHMDDIATAEIGLEPRQHAVAIGGYVGNAVVSLVSIIASIESATNLGSLTQGFIYASLFVFKMGAGYQGYKNTVGAYKKENARASQSSSKAKNDDDINPESEEKCWRWFNVVDSFGTNFTSSAYSISSLITLACTAAEYFPGISIAGLGVGLPLGLVLSICIAQACNMLNKHMNEHAAAPDVKRGGLSGGQRIKAVGHYASDIVGSLTSAVATLEGSANFSSARKFLTPNHRAFIYSGLSVFKGLSNWQEYKNCVTAYVGKEPVSVRESLRRCCR